MKVRQMAWVLALGISTFAQEWGTIIFANRNVPHTTEGVTYNIPIWKYGNAGMEGAGGLPGGVTAGLFLPGNNTPLATAILRTDANAQFFGNPSSQTVTVTGHLPGSTPTLVFRAWQGAGGFDAAINSGLQYFEDTFTTRPLGGMPPGGGLPIIPPGLTGLRLNGSGFTMIPEPAVFSLACLGLGALCCSRRRQ